MSKESDAARKWQYGIGLLVVASILAGVFVLRDDEEPAVADCASTTDVSVAASPEIAEVVTSAAERAADEACTTYDVQAQAPAVVAQSIAVGDGVPDIWIPDSTLWLGRVQAQLVEGAQGPQVVSESVAATPVVLAGQADAIASPQTWLQALSSPQFVSGDPLASTEATVPLIASQAEAAKGVTDAEQVSAAVVALAQNQTVDKAVSDNAGLIKQAAGGSTVVLTEQALASNPDAAALTGVVPKTGTMMLNYPLAVTADTATDAASALAGALSSASGVGDLTAAGFRTPDGAAPDEGGVGAFTPITVDDPAAVTKLLRSWSSIALPGQTLAVIDVSGSMAAQAGDSTRMELTIQSALTGLAAMPDSWKIGTWAFSVGLDGDKDYKELAPIRRLGSSSGGVTHRRVEERVTSELGSLVGGGTGLYDTVLAAYRTVQSQYDPRAVNSVIVLTDGRNEDSNSLSLSELLATLQRERDPARPVIVIALGITKDADESALKKIANVTGGLSYIAREPADIPAVFVDALQSRG
ncbi:UNVERIFIED_CONTAM: hypothetical protein LK11_25940 [Mumia flava]|nr:VWA domain-containing protein [Mumia flava]